jgi:DNA-binding GntR family transcriptional regulator
MEHMVLFRALIEGAAARLIASRRDPEVIARLADILEAMAQAREQRDQLGFLNYLWEFHSTICAKSGNPFLLQAWSAASNLTRLYMHRAVATVDHDEQLANNGAILNSLRNDYPGRAEQVTRALLIRVAYKILARDIPDALMDYVKDSPSAEGRSASVVAKRRRAVPEKM